MACIKCDNIILIGMPGVGKSTLGVILAKLIGYCFCDTDLVIQQTAGRLLCDIISERGVDGFIKLENSVNASIATRRTVIATGGSVVYGREAMENLSSLGAVVYLKQRFDILDARLSDIKGRGVVLRQGQDLRALYEERAPHYERYADITVELGHGSVEDNVKKVLDALDGFEK